MICHCEPLFGEAIYRTNYQAYHEEIASTPTGSRNDE